MCCSSLHRAWGRRFLSNSDLVTLRWTWQMWQCQIMSNWKNVELVEKCLNNACWQVYTASQVLQHTHARTCQDGSWRCNIPCKITCTWVVQCTTFYDTKKHSATLSYWAGHFLRSQQIPYLWIIMNYPFRRCMTWTILNILCVFSYTWYIQKQYYDNIYLYINSIIYT